MTETPPAGQPVIVVRDLRFRYPGSGDDVLRVPFLDVPARGMTAITGPSGAGKSTLIELLAGTLREQYEGSVQVLGTEWKSLTRDADRQRQLRRIGLIPQDYGLLANRTPVALLEQDLADAGISRDQRPARITAALEAVGLGSFSERNISGLSGGQRQRVAIARMLARGVECVIADEPTANLDPALTADAMRLFRHLAGQVPVVIITHDPAVADVCDRTIVLQAAVSSPSTRPAPDTGRQRRRRALALVGAGGALAVVAAAALIMTGVISLHPVSARPEAASHSSKTSHPQTASPSSVPSTGSAAVRRPARAARPATQVVVYEPWTATGLAAGISVAATDSGSCWEGSLAAYPRTDAYRCAAGNYILDPCFSNPYSGSGDGQVACTYPGPQSVTVVNLTSPLPPPPTAQTSGQPSPWLIVLADGQQCTAITGTSIVVGGMRLNYGCSNGGLYGSPHHAGRTWTIFYQAKGASTMTLVPIAQLYE